MPLRSLGKVIWTWSYTAAELSADLALREWLWVGNVQTIASRPQFVESKFRAGIEFYSVLHGSTPCKVFDRGSGVFNTLLAEFLPQFPAFSCALSFIF